MNPYNRNFEFKHMYSLIGKNISDPDVINLIEYFHKEVRNNFQINMNGVNSHRPLFHSKEIVIKYHQKPSKNLATNKKPLTKNLVSG
jgi:hypothetical protein